MLEGDRNLGAEATETSSFRGKLHLYYFVGLMSRWLPSPAANRIRRGLRQDWMSTLNIDGLDASVRRDQSVDFDGTLQRHAPGKGRIFRRGACQQLPRRAGLLRP